MQIGYLPVETLEERVTRIVNSYNKAVGIMVGLIGVVLLIESRNRKYKFWRIILAVFFLMLGMLLLSGYCNNFGIMIGRYWAQRSEEREQREQQAQQDQQGRTVDNNLQLTGGGHGRNASGQRDVDIES
jgi:hypothetical protein